MRDVVLFIAMSLDGYIADKNGGVGWLSGQGDADEPMDSYGTFIKDVDTVVMGWNTYHQVVTELSPGQWVYEGLNTYVITHRNLTSEEGIVFTVQDPCELIKNLRKEDGRRIWICGGADLIRQLEGANLIDEYQLSVIPVILGSGIRLFSPASEEKNLKLLRSREYGGIAELVYRKR